LLLLVRSGIRGRNGSESVPFRDTASRGMGRTDPAKEEAMWRSIFVLLLLAGPSPALAGQARGTLQVGITITGTVARPVAKGATVGSGRHLVSGSPGEAKEQRR
jgi:hypothetical protein